MKEAPDPTPGDPAQPADRGPQLTGSARRSKSPFADLDGPRRVANWIVHLKKVEDRLSILSDDRQKIELVARWSGENPALRGKSHTFIWSMGRWFAHWAIMEAAALFDDDTRTYSARHVLVDALDQPDLVTFDSFAAAEEHEEFPKLRGKARWSNLGSDAWNETWQGGSTKDVRRLLVDALRSVNEARKRHAAYRDKVVAHQDRDPPQPPTFGDVYAAVDAALTAYSKVRVLFVGGSLGHTVDLTDWADIFEVPWVSSPSGDVT